MNIVHNLRPRRGLAFCDLTSGQLYLRIDIPSKRPLVYLAVAGRPQPLPAENLVNMETGCLVGRVAASARFVHLDNATLDTGM